MKVVAAVSAAPVVAAAISKPAAAKAGSAPAEKKSRPAPAPVVDKGVAAAAPPVKKPDAAPSEAEKKTSEKKDDSERIRVQKKILKDIKSAPKDPARTGAAACTAAAAKATTAAKQKKPAVAQPTYVPKKESKAKPAAPASAGKPPKKGKDNGKLSKTAGNAAAVASAPPESEVMSAVRPRPAKLLAIEVRAPELKAPKRDEPKKEPKGPPVEQVAPNAAAARAEAATEAHQLLASSAKGWRTTGFVQPDEVSRFGPQDYALLEKLECSYGPCKKAKCEHEVHKNAFYMVPSLLPGGTNLLHPRVRAWVPTLEPKALVRYQSRFPGYLCKFGVKNTNHPISAISRVVALRHVFDTYIESSIEAPPPQKSRPPGDPDVPESVEPVEPPRTIKVLDLGGSSARWMECGAFQRGGFSVHCTNPRVGGAGKWDQRLLISSCRCIAPAHCAACKHDQFDFVVSLHSAYYAGVREVLVAAVAHCPAIAIIDVGAPGDSLYSDEVRYEASRVGDASVEGSVVSGGVSVYTDALGAARYSHEAVASWLYDGPITWRALTPSSASSAKECVIITPDPLTAPSRANTGVPWEIITSESVVSHRMADAVNDVDALSVAVRKDVLEELRTQCAQVPGNDVNATANVDMVIRRSLSSVIRGVDYHGAPEVYVGNLRNLIMGERAASALRTAASEVRHIPVRAEIAAARTQSGNLVRAAKFVQHWKSPVQLIHPRRALLVLRETEWHRMVSHVLPPDASREERGALYGTLWAYAIVTAIFVMLCGVAEEAVVRRLTKNVRVDWEATLLRVVLHCVVAGLERFCGAPPVVLVPHLFLPWLEGGSAFAAHTLLNLMAVCGHYALLLQPEIIFGGDAEQLGPLTAAFGRWFGGRAARAATNSRRLPTYDVASRGQRYQRITPDDEDDLQAQIRGPSMPPACFALWCLEWLLGERDQDWALEKLQLWNQNRLCAYDDLGAGELPVGVSLRPSLVKEIDHKRVYVIKQHAGLDTKYRVGRPCDGERAETHWRSRVILYVTDYPAVLPMPDLEVAISTRMLISADPYWSKDAFMHADEWVAEYLALYPREELPAFECKEMDDELDAPGAYTPAQRAHIRNDAEVRYGGFLKREFVALGKEKEVEEAPAMFTLEAKPRVIVACPGKSHQPLLVLEKAAARAAAATLDLEASGLNCLAVTTTQLSVRHHLAMLRGRWAIEVDGKSWDAWQTPVYKAADTLMVCRNNPNMFRLFEESGTNHQRNVSFGQEHVVQHYAAHLSGESNTSGRNTRCNLLLSGLALARACMVTEAKWHPSDAMRDATGDDQKVELPVFEKPSPEFLRTYLGECTYRAHPSEGFLVNSKLASYCSMLPWPCKPIIVERADGHGPVVLRYHYATMPGRAIRARGCRHTNYTINTEKWLMRVAAQDEIRRAGHVPMLRVVLRHIIRLTEGVKEPRRVPYQRIHELEAKATDVGVMPEGRSEDDDETEHMMHALYGPPSRGPSWVGPGGAEEQLERLLSRVRKVPFWLSDINVNQIMRIEPNGPLTPEAEY